MSEYLPLICEGQRKEESEIIVINKCPNQLVIEWIFDCQKKFRFTSKEHQEKKVQEDILMYKKLCYVVLLVHL